MTDLKYYELLDSEYELLIGSLEDYLANSITGNNLISVWEKCPKNFLPIYYNICHLVGDEDIRQKDRCYSDRQFHQLEDLIIGLKNKRNIEQLAQISFI